MVFMWRAKLTKVTFSRAENTISHDARDKMWVAKFVLSLLLVLGAGAVCPKTYCTTLTTCWNHGECEIDYLGNEACVCDEGWTGTNCQTRTCSESTCVNGNCCVSGCCCDPGWSGATCNTFVGIDNAGDMHCQASGACICGPSKVNCASLYPTPAPYLTDLTVLPFTKNAMSIDYYTPDPCDCRIGGAGSPFLGTGVRKLLRVPAQVHNTGPSNLFLGTPHSPAFQYDCTNTPLTPSWIKMTLMQVTVSAPFTLADIIAYVIANPLLTPPGIGCSTTTAGSTVMTVTRGRMSMDQMNVDSNIYAPQFIESMQGLTQGWAQDIPAGMCEAMWLDVTSITPGEYILRVEVNPLQAALITEQDYTNNVLDVLLTCNPSCVHGTCDFGIKCVCNSGWTGPACDVAAGCTPDCTGRDCGPDSCGGFCGICARGHTCDDDFHCTCAPECSRSECGSDHCCGYCGVCRKPFTSCQSCEERGIDCDDIIYACASI